MSKHKGYNSPPYGGGVGGEALIFNHRVDVLVVTSHAVVVKAVTNDEGIGNLHGAVIYLERSRETFWFLQERAYLHALGTLVEELRQEVVHGVARVDDVLDDDDVTSLKIGVYANEFAQHTCALHSFVTGELGKENLRLECQFAYQVGSKHERTVQDAHHDGVFAGIVLVQTCGHLLYFLLD